MIEAAAVWTVTVQISIAVLSLAGTGDPPNAKHQGYFTSQAECVAYVGKHWRDIRASLPEVVALALTQKDIRCKKREMMK